MPVEPRVCTTCGSTYAPVNGRQKRCEACQKGHWLAVSREARRKQRAASGKFLVASLKTCRRCTIEFPARVHNAAFCDTCQPLAEREREVRGREVRRQKLGSTRRGTMRVCVDCGGGFSYRAGVQLRCAACQKKLTAKALWEYSKSHPNRPAWKRKAHGRHYFAGNKDAVLIRDGFRCRACGTAEKLHVHHIDNAGKGRPVAEKNNALDNLITLCSMCHTRLHRDTERLLYARHMETVREALEQFLHSASAPQSEIESDAEAA